MRYLIIIINVCCIAACCRALNVEQVREDLTLQPMVEEAYRLIYSGESDVLVGTYLYGSEAKSSPELRVYAYNLLKSYYDFIYTGDRVDLKKLTTDYMAVREQITPQLELRFLELKYFLSGEPDYAVKIISKYPHFTKDIIKYDNDNKHMLLSTMLDYFDERDNICSSSTGIEERVIINQIARDYIIYLESAASESDGRLFARLANLYPCMRGKGGPEAIDIIERVGSKLSREQYRILTLSVLKELSNEDTRELFIISAEHL